MARACGGYSDAAGHLRVFGANGPIGWTDKPLADGPGVILGRKGAYRGVHYSPDPFFVIDTAYYVVPKTDLDMRWLYYAVIHHQLGQIDDGSPIPSTTRAAVYPREIFVPSPQEQRAIAGVLGALDDKIEQNRTTARALERLARAIFRAWFVDFEPMKAKAAGRTSFPCIPQSVFDRLPTHFIDSDIGPVPKGWEVKGIASIATFLNGLALQKYPPRGDGEDLPVIKIAELRNGSVDGANLANSDVSAQYVIDDRDLLFSWSGTLEAKFWFGGKGVLNQHLFKVTSSHFPSWFSLLWIRQHLPWFRAIAASKATTMGHIKREHLQETQVVVPPSEVLHEANEVIGVIYDLFGQLMIESRKLMAMRDVLLPKLLSGKARVSVDGGGPLVSLDRPFELHSCRQLLERYPTSTSLRPAVEVIERTIQDDPGIAFTHCRGLLETVCVTILADCGRKIPPNSRPNWLMSQVISTLQLTDLNPDNKEAEGGVASILRGLNSLVDGIVALRNSQGVGPHGRDALEPVLSVEYAILAATAVDAAVGLLFRLHQEQIGRDPINHLRFGVHKEFDSYLDAKYSDIEIEEVVISASEALHHQDRQAYRKSLVEFRNRSEAESEEIAEGESISEDSDG